jgi:hypothetical protein
MRELLCQAKRPMVVYHPVGRWKHLDRFVLRHCTCVPVPSRATYGRLSPRWPGVRDDAVLCAWASTRFPTEYDGKGYGLMRLAGHTRSLLTHLCEGRVGEHKAMCNVLRLRRVGGYVRFCLCLFLSCVRLVVS